MSFLAIFILALFTTSCSDWLTVEPEDELLKEDYWETTEDVEAFLAAMYNDVQASTDENFIWGELRGDLIEFSSDDFGNYTKIKAYNISSSNGSIVWDHYYESINMANTLMYYDDEVYENDDTFTEDLMNQIEGEALFVRALNHFYLVRLWQDVPIMRYPTISDTSSIYVAASSESDVIDFIIDDLTEAKDIASDDTELKGRANKYAVMALLADVYLWKGAMTDDVADYQLAVQYCDSVTAGGYSLVDYSDWFDLYSPGNSSTESIFEIQFDEDDDETNPMYSSLIDLTDFDGIWDGEGYDDLYDDYYGDIRTLTYYKYVLSSYYPLTSVYTWRTTDEEDANFIYYRYADILLIKAEALNEIGGYEDDVNELLSETKERALMSHTSVSGQANLRLEILDERGREFGAEGKRWFDLLRYARKNDWANQDYLVEILSEGFSTIQDYAAYSSDMYNTASYFLPYPDDDVTYNPNLDQKEYYE
jgi:hypothetical protein